MAVPMILLAIGCGALSLLVWRRTGQSDPVRTGRGSSAKGNRDLVNKERK